MDLWILLYKLECAKTKANKKTNKNHYLNSDAHPTSLRGNLILIIIWTFLIHPLRLYKCLGDQKIERYSHWFIVYTSQHWYCSFSLLQWLWYFCYVWLWKSLAKQRIQIPWFISTVVTLLPWVLSGHESLLF